MMGTSHNALTERVASEWMRGRSGRLARTGGSDSHTEHHIGTTFTEADASSCEHFLEELKAGRTRAGGAHGGTVRLAREIYGVIFNYWAGLMGIRRHECQPLARVGGVVMSAISLPLMFIPAATSVVHGLGESRRITRYCELVRPQPGGSD